MEVWPGRSLELNYAKWLRTKVEHRFLQKKASDAPVVKKEETSSADSDSRAADKPDVVKKPWEKPSSVSRVNSASKSQDKSPVSPATAAPLNRTRPGSSTGDATDMEKLKQLESSDTQQQKPVK
ncbi:hypothetical protein cypCar_00029957 [Cyprinus carpio]|nr:hypothetical protein cypCar_00029957 [Cyprinus carpio]